MNRNNTVKTRLTHPEKQALQHKADENSQSMSDFVRRCVLDEIGDVENPAESDSEDEPKPFDQEDYRARQRENMDRFGDTLDGSLLWPIPIDIIDDWQSTIASPQIRIPLIRGLLEEFVERNENLGCMPDAELRRILSGEFGMSPRSVGRYINRCIDSRVAFPDPAADPAFSREELRSALVDAKANVGGMPKADIRTNLESPESFFSAIDDVPIPGRQGCWYLDESNRDAAVSGLVGRAEELHAAASSPTSKATTRVLLMHLRAWYNLRIDNE